MSETATVVILPTLQEQMESGDDTLIDPEVLHFAGLESGPIFRDGQYRVPDDIAGRYSNLRIEDGRLVADVELNADEKSNHFSPAAMRGGGEARLIAIHGYYAPCKDAAPDDDCEDA